MRGTQSYLDIYKLSANSKLLQITRKKWRCLYVLLKKVSRNDYRGVAASGRLLHWNDYEEKYSTMSVWYKRIVK